MESCQNFELCGFFSFFRRGMSITTSVVGLVWQGCHQFITLRIHIHSKHDEQDAQHRAVQFVCNSSDL